MDVDIPERIIDTHHHLWEIAAVDYPWLRTRGEPRFFGDPTPIQCEYPPAAFRADWEGMNVVASVHIQVGAAKGAEIDETRWLAAQSEASGLPSAIVAAVDLTDTRVHQLIDCHQRRPVDCGG